MIWNLKTIGGIRTDFTHAYLYGGGRLGQIMEVFETEHFNELLAIFKERYGKPTEVKKEPWQSKAGTVFDNLIVEWEGKNHISIQARTHEKEKRMIVVNTTNYLLIEGHKRDKRRKEAARDL